MPGSPSTSTRPRKGSAGRQISEGWRARVGPWGLSGVPELQEVGASPLQSPPRNAREARRLLLLPSTSAEVPPSLLYSTNLYLAPLCASHSQVLRIQRKAKSDRLHAQEVAPHPHPLPTPCVALTAQGPTPHLRHPHGPVLDSHPENTASTKFPVLVHPHNSWALAKSVSFSISHP